MKHPAIGAGRTAVVTGAASGIGFAAAQAFARAGMRLVLADLPGEALENARRLLASSGADVVAVATDVGDRGAMEALAKAASGEGGQAPSLVMLNAGVEAGGTLFSDEATWRAILDTNLWGVINGIQVFAPGMMAADRSGAIVVTGSKQGITTPPGNTPYNVSKAGVKVATEALAHELRERGSAVSAHLLIPGFVYTGLTEARGVTQKPDGAWTPEATVEFLFESMGRGDFYILCPDNETTTEQDRRRMEWAVGDVIENRPALSRWHPDFKDAFAEHMKR